MRRAVAVLACCSTCALGGVPGRARASDALPPAAPPPPAAAGPEQIQFAAHEHDLGYRAYVARHYDEAAAHFENAFFAAPNPAELRSAIRARRDGGELARAATLAALGQRKFPADAPTARLADETIAEARARVYEVRIASSADCNVAVDAKIVALEKVRDFRFFVDPGRHDLAVGWSGDAIRHVSVDATAGGSESLSLDPPAAPAPPPPQAAQEPPAVVATAPVLATTALPEPAGAPAKPWGPAVFLTGLGLTAVASGLTVWSGIDAENHPGRDAVRAACVGQGTGCPEYQRGLSAQLRTNVILSTACVLAAATAVVGLFFTRWSPPTAPPAAGSVRLGAEGVSGAF